MRGNSVHDPILITNKDPHPWISKKVLEIEFLTRGSRTSFPESQFFRVIIFRGERSCDILRRHQSRFLLHCFFSSFLSGDKLLRSMIPKMAEAGVARQGDLGFNLGL